MTAKIVHLVLGDCTGTDKPIGLGETATINYPDRKQRSVACRQVRPGVWLCAYAESEQEQLALEARLERKRFKKRARPVPPAA